MKKCFTINCMRNESDFRGYNELIENNVYQGIEIFYPYNVTEEQGKFYTNSINELRKKFPNLEIVMHLPHGKQNSLTDEYLDESYKLMINAIEYAKNFNVKKLTLHLGSVKENKLRHLYLDEIVPVLQSLCDYISKYQMILMIENMPGMNELGYDSSEILEIINKTNRNNIKFILDTGHAFVAKKSLTEYIKDLKDYLVHIHFNDNDGLRDEHKRMHLGKIDFKEVFEMLKEIKYDQLHCMEVIFKEYKELIDFAKDLDEYK